MPGRRAVGPAAGELQRGIRARLIGRSVPPVSGAPVINKTSGKGRDSAREPLAEQREQAAYGRPRSRKRPQESMSAGEWARQLNGKVIYGVGAGADRTQESGQTGREREEKGSHTQEAEEFTPLELEEPDILSHQRMWARLRRKYPKILAFDYDDGCEILTIKPQDIGLLPREVWVFGNNSFLLHGYYSYRYLILARLEIRMESRGICWEFPAITIQMKNTWPPCLASLISYCRKSSHPEMTASGTGIRISV